MELLTLKSKLSDTNERSERHIKSLEEDSNTKLEEDLVDLQLERTQIKERIEHLNRLILTSSSLQPNTFNSKIVPFAANVGRRHRVQECGTN